LLTKNIKERNYRQNYPLDVLAASRWANQAQSWHIRFRIRRVWREPLGVASLPQYKRLLRLGA
jgi:hypothetical protein